MSEKGSGEGESILHNYRQPKLRPDTPKREAERVPTYERPGWPSRAEHEAERKAILDRGAIYLTIEEVAARYGRPVKWVYRCKGLNKYRRHAGKYLVFRLQDLIEFEEARSKTENRGFSVKVMRPHVERAVTGKPVNPLKMDIL